MAQLVPRLDAALERMVLPGTATAGAHAIVTHARPSGAVVG